MICDFVSFDNSFVYALLRDIFEAMWGLSRSNVNDLGGIPRYRDRLKGYRTH